MEIFAHNISHFRLEQREEERGGKWEEYPRYGQWGEDEQSELDIEIYDLLHAMRCIF